MTNDQRLRVRGGLGGGLSCLGEAREGRRAGDRELGQALAVEGDAGVFQAVDQLSVGHAVLAGGGVDPDDPEAAEIAFLPAPADEGVFERRVDRLFRGAVQLTLVGVVSLRQPEQFLPFGAPNISPFYARHLSTPSYQQSAS